MKNLLLTSVKWRTFKQVARAYDRDVGRLTKERDESVKKVERVTKERDESVKKVERVTQERDESVKKVERVTQELDESVRKVERVTQERDESVKKLERVTQERDESVKKLERVTKERDELVGKVDHERVTQERDELIASKLEIFLWLCWWTEFFHPGNPGQVRPSDYNEMQASSTKGWPDAIKVLKNEDVFNTVKAEHDQIMKDWVERRGDGLSSDNYDYLVYSHAVAWKKALKAKVVFNDVEHIMSIYKV